MKHICVGIFLSLAFLFSACSSDSDEEEAVFPEEVGALQSGQRIFIDNAGLVLTNPYLPFLFERAGLMTNNNFVSPAAQEEAAHLIQFMATGSTNSADNLALNKILVGLHPTAAIAEQAAVPEAQQQLGTSALQSLIAHWEIIKNTSVQGLRESFLQREGYLVEANEYWDLVVAQKSLDVLVDRIPFQIKTIRYPWMSKSVRVRWR